MVYRPGLSGGVRVTAQYAEALTARGHEVRIVGTRHPRPTVREHVRNLLKGGGVAKARPVSAFLANGSAALHLASDEDDVTSDFFPDADVTIATFWKTAHWVNALPAQKGRKVYFIQHHEIHPWYDHDDVAATYRMPLKKIVISDWLRDIMAREYGDADVPIIHNGIDTERFNAPPREKNSRPTAGVMISNNTWKGTEDALAAFLMLKERLPETELIFFGSMPPSADAAAMGARIYTTPPEADIPKIYAACDVWLSASHVEGFGLPAFEAMACRTPVVSTTAGASPDFIRDGENGFLVAPKDVNAMVDRLRRVLTMEPAAWRVMSEAARATTLDMQWDRAVDAFEAELYRVVET
ncbi:MAG: glycosyltransferase family 4 protein [Pseudomonadota bacterium]